MDLKKARRILKKYNAGNCTEREKNLVENWYLYESAKIPPIDTENPLEEEIIIRDKILESIGRSDRTIRIKRLRWMSAAASILLVSITFYLYKNKFSKSSGMMVIQAKDVNPGQNKAILTLSNGAKISLDDSTKGIVAKQLGQQIIKDKNGRISYHKDETIQHNDQNAERLFNTLNVPIGSHYRIELPDGTRVWLNASSSLKYPLRFQGKERRVELAGEAYFEVTHNKTMPFIVETSEQDITVLGTHFNVNSYADEESTKTTLLQGRVKVTQRSNQDYKIIQPGQQVSLSRSGLKVSKADTALVVAWKEGLFKFNHTDLHAVMRQVSRWYNVQVIYEGDIQNDQFFGEVERKYSLDEVLKVLELDGLHFRVEKNTIKDGQKKLIIMP